ncbi:riboflavin synthase [Paenibacillus sp. y28]|uniref:riboflavin synthase n=1 Tax=Paenibacillus sp. y28 TaxID=3129110 RepID=UPI003017F3B5
MFTGLIEEIGTLRRVHRRGQSLILTLEARKILEDVQLGDSIAVNGVCLTVIEFDRQQFSVDVMPETFRQTTLRELSPGSRVNLERAMTMGRRFGGHHVQGHVDTVGRILNRSREENAVVFRIEPEDRQVMKYVVPRGSITLDGISLTVVEAGTQHFTVSVIPHTLVETVLLQREAGDSVNIECDVLGKYVERLLAFGAGGPLVEHMEQEKGAGRPNGGLSAQFLADNGFM